MKGIGICVNVHLENAYNRESETKAERTKVDKLLWFDRADEDRLFGRLDSPDAVISVVLFSLFKLSRTTGTVHPLVRQFFKYRQFALLVTDALV